MQMRSARVLQASNTIQQTLTIPWKLKRKRKKESSLRVLLVHIYMLAVLIAVNVFIVHILNILSGTPSVDTIWNDEMRQNVQVRGRERESELDTVSMNKTVLKKTVFCFSLLLVLCLTWSYSSRTAPKTKHKTLPNIKRMTQSYLNCRTQTDTFTQKIKIDPWLI